MSSGNNSTNDQRIFLDELKQLALSEGCASAKFQETDHPSENELYDYVSGQLPKEQLPTVMRHLSKCSECSREVWRLRSFLEESNQASLAWANGAELHQKEDKT